MTDRARVADLDNPRGYYEWEPIKQIGKKPELLDEEWFDGRGIKCVSMLLPPWPLRHNYKVIFMTRPIEEMVASQHAMTTRLGTKGASLEPEQLERGLRAHREEVQKWAQTAPHIEWLEVEYQGRDTTQRRRSPRWSSLGGGSACLTSRRWPR